MLGGAESISALRNPFGRLVPAVANLIVVDVSDHCYWMISSMTHMSMQTILQKMRRRVAMATTSTVPSSAMMGVLKVSSLCNSSS